MRKLRVLSAIMALVMLITVFPVQSFANATPGNSGEKTGKYSFSIKYDGNVVNTDAYSISIVRIWYDWGKEKREEVTPTVANGKYTFDLKEDKKGEYTITFNGNGNYFFKGDEGYSTTVSKSFDKWSFNNNSKTVNVYKKYKVTVNGDDGAIFRDGKLSVYESADSSTGILVESISNEKSYSFYISGNKTYFYSFDKVEGYVKPNHVPFSVSGTAGAIDLPSFDYSVEVKRTISIENKLSQLSDLKITKECRDGDANGIEVTLDMSDPDNPIVKVTAKKAGDYTIKATGKTSEGNTKTVKIDVYAFEPLAFLDDDYDNDDVVSTNGTVEKTIFVKDSVEQIEIPKVSKTHECADINWSIEPSDAGLSIERTNQYTVYRVKNTKKFHGIATVTITSKISSMASGQYENKITYKLVFLEEDAKADAGNLTIKDSTGAVVCESEAGKEKMGAITVGKNADSVAKYSCIYNPGTSAIYSWFDMTDGGTKASIEEDGTNATSASRKFVLTAESSDGDKKNDDQNLVTFKYFAIYNGYHYYDGTKKVHINKNEQAEFSFARNAPTEESAIIKTMKDTDCSNPIKAVDADVVYDEGVKEWEYEFFTLNDQKNPLCADDDTFLELKKTVYEEDENDPNKTKKYKTYFSKNTGVIYKPCDYGTYKVVATRSGNDYFYPSSKAYYISFGQVEQNLKLDNDGVFEVWYNAGAVSYYNALTGEGSDEPAVYTFVENPGKGDAERTFSENDLAKISPNGYIETKDLGKTGELTVKVTKKGNKVYTAMKAKYFKIDIKMLKVSTDMTYVEGTQLNSESNWYVRTATIRGREKFNNNAYAVSANLKKDGWDENAYVASTNNINKYSFGVRQYSVVDNKETVAMGPGEREVQIDLENPSMTVRTTNSVTDKEYSAELDTTLTPDERLSWINDTCYIQKSSSFYFKASDATSQLASVQYRVVSDTSRVLSDSELDALTGWADFDTEVNCGFTDRFDFDKGVIYFKATDNAGRTSYVSTNGLVCDSVKPSVGIALPDKKTDVYSGDVKVTLNVSDDNSGVDTVVAIINGTRKKLDYKGGDSVSFVVSAKDYNENNISVIAEVTDKSGNTNTAKAMFSIDTTAPTIDVAYDNNDAETNNYFAEKRTATIKITERNFNAANVKISVANSDNKSEVPTISNWSTHKGDGNGDGTYHTATITYSKDGAYTFDVEFVDGAGIKAGEVNYGNSVAPTDFVIDQTNPVLDVVYNNNDVANEKYYKAARTATVTIKEHNFDESLVEFSATEGEAKLSSWKNDGDVHTATISFTEDGKYGWTISTNDKALRSSDLFSDKEFVIDQTLPTVEIEGVDANAIYTETEGLTIKVSAKDENLDKLDVQLSYVVYDSSTNKIEEKIITANTQMTKKAATAVIPGIKADAIYELKVVATDLAGNESADSVKQKTIFSINNNGSTFRPDDYTLKLMKDKYTQNVTQNIVIYEVNVNGFKKDKCSIFVNDVQLSENQCDVKEKKDGWYTNIYSANASNFADEMQYNVVINSNDANGTASYSDVKGVKVDFVVDRTAPSINVNGVEANKSYETEELPVTIMATDDGGKIDTLSIVVLDETGETYSNVYDKSGDELRTDLAENDGKVDFSIPEGENLSLVVTSSDVAGNVSGEETGGKVELAGITVSDKIVDIPDVITEDGFNVYASAGGIVAIVIILVLIVGFFAMKRKKKSNEN